MPRGRQVCAWRSDTTVCARYRTGAHACQCVCVWGGSTQSGVSGWGLLDSWDICVPRGKWSAYGEARQPCVQGVGQEHMHVRVWGGGAEHYWVLGVDSRLGATAQCGSMYQVGTHVLSTVIQTHPPPPARVLWARSVVRAVVRSSVQQWSPRAPWVRLVVSKTSTGRRKRV